MRLLLLLLALLPPAGAEDHLSDDAAAELQPILEGLSNLFEDVRACPRDTRLRALASVAVSQQALLAAQRAADVSLPTVTLHPNDDPRYWADVAAMTYQADWEAAVRAGGETGRALRDDLVEARWTADYAEPAYFVALDRPRTRIVVGVRGSLELVDWLTDLSVRETPFQGSTAHGGIAAAATRLRERLAPLLADLRAGLPRRFRVTYVGHSYGGGVAALMALQHPKSDSGLRAVTFGAPPVLAPASQRLVQLADRRVTAFVLDDDMVPRASMANVERLREAVVSHCGGSGSGGGSGGVLDAVGGYLHSHRHALYHRARDVVSTVAPKPEAAGIFDAVMREFVPGLDGGEQREQQLAVVGRVLHLRHALDGTPKLQAASRDALGEFIVTHTMAAMHYMGRYREALELFYSGEAAYEYSRRYPSSVPAGGM